MSVCPTDRPSVYRPPCLSTCQGAERGRDRGDGAISYADVRDARSKKGLFVQLQITFFSPFLAGCGCLRIRGLPGLATVGSRNDSTLPVLFASGKKGWPRRHRT